MLCVGLEPPAARGHGNAIANGGQDILQRPAGRRVIKNLVRRDKRKSIALRSLAQSRFLDDFVFAPMPSNHSIKPVAEGITEIACNFVGLYFAYDQTLVAAPERNEPLRMMINFVPRDGALAFFGAQPSRRQKPAEIRIAAPVLGQKNDYRFIFHCYLRTDDQP